MLKKLVTKAVGALGYEVFHHSRLMPSDMAQHVRKVFDVLQVDCVIDVGANVGQFAHFVRTMVGFQGPLFSFEPVREVHEVLAQKARSDPQWRTFNCAVGAADARQEINVMRSSELTSFLKPAEDETALFSDYNVIERKESVDVRALDSMMGEFRQSGAAGSIYLKVDTQGYDREVFQGAQRLLADVCALQTEIAVQRLYAGMPNYVGTLQDLHEKGFDLSGIYPIQQDSLLRLIEADCIMVNRTLAQTREVRLLQVPGLTHM
jgi:FkbM family methyltransferase